VTPPLTQNGKGLNPGYIAPEAFYNTYNNVQSKYNWGSKGFQTGPKFDARGYNQAYGSETPWGLQQMAQPLSGSQIADIIAGRDLAAGPVVPNANRRDAYNPASMITPDATNTYQLPTIAQRAPTSAVAPVSTNPADTAQQAEISRQLGANWFNRQQAAAAAGDWETYNDIQQKVNAIINPVVDRY
jgi:hypothetical protein